MSNKFSGGFLRDLTRALVVSSLVEGAKMRNGFLRGPEGELIVTPDLSSSVVSSSGAEAEQVPVADGEGGYAWGAGGGGISEAKVKELIAAGLPYVRVVEDYGADPTGATDSSTAFTEAIAAMDENRGGVIDLGSQGKFYIASALTCTKPGVAFIGGGGSGVSSDLSNSSVRIEVGDGIWGLTLGSAAASTFLGYRIENIEFCEKNTGKALGGVRVYRTSNNRFVGGSTGKFTEGTGFLVDGTGGQSQYNVFFDWHFGKCKIGYQQKAANGTRQIACYYEGSTNGSTPTAGTTGCLVTSGDSFRSIGTVYQGFDTLVDLGPNQGHEITSGRFEIFTAVGVVVRNGSEGARVHGTLNNSLVGAEKGIGVELESGVVDPVVDVYMASVGTKVEDKGATRPTLRVNPTRGGTVTAALTSSSNYISADVTMTTAGTFYDGPTLTLAAGTYLLTGVVQLLASTKAIRTWQAKLWDGTTALSSGVDVIDGTGAEGQGSIPVNGIVTISEEKTYKISATSSVNADTLRGTGIKGSYLNAVKIA